LQIRSGFASKWINLSGFSPSRAGIRRDHCHSRSPAAAQPGGIATVRRMDKERSQHSDIEVHFAK
jgi:hypothetical protein